MSECKVCGESLNLYCVDCFNKAIAQARFEAIADFALWFQSQWNPKGKVDFIKVKEELTQRMEELKRGGKNG